MDRDLWERLTRAAGPFDADGALSHLRPSSLEALRNGYGFFLKHVLDGGIEPNIAPPDRASLDNLRSYLASLEGLTTRTKSGYFSALKTVLTRGYPDRDWRHLQAAVSNLAYRADQEGSRCDDEFLPLSTDLIRFASDLERAGAGGEDTLCRAEAVRDSLMLRLLATHPLRLKNFAELQIGTSVVAHGDRYSITFAPSEMKNHRPLSFTLSRELSARLRVYIADVRPLFPSGENRTIGRLWLRFKYGAWEKVAIGRHISRLTERGLGSRVTPHLFRHAAATTIADIEGADARIIRPLLGHASDATAQRYYIQANQSTAAKHYQNAVREIVKSDR